MKLLLAFLVWCVLLLFCWPLAVLTVVLLPLLWLVSLPIRLLLVAVSAAFALFKSILFLPARLLGYRE